MYDMKGINEDRDYSDILITKRNTQEYLRQSGLKKNLTSEHLCGIAIGAVIAGQFMGWNNGLRHVGPYGLIIATACVSVFYLLFISFLSKLAVNYPYAGGSYAYARKAFGKFGGFFAGISTIIELLCIAAVILIYMNAYIRDLMSPFWADITTLIIFAVLILVQHAGIREAALIQLVVTCVCVSIFLLFFMGINSVIPYKASFEFAFPNGISGFFLAMPYVFWFFIGIDVIAMTAEESKNPSKSIPASFFFSLSAIIFLSFGIIWFSVGKIDWRILTSAQYPLIFILKQLQGKDDVLISVFSFFSLSSFIAGLNGIITGFSRQVFSLSRAGYLPGLLNKIFKKTRVPYAAILVSSFLILILGEAGNANMLIIIACMCAIISYGFTLASYIKLILRNSGMRKKKAADFAAYVLLAVCFCILGIFIIFQKSAALMIFGIYSCLLLYYMLVSKNRINNDAPEEAEANTDEINIIITNI